MGRDTEIREKIAVIHAKIDQLNERLKMIPGEIEHLETARTQLRDEIIRITKRMHERGEIKESTEYAARAQNQLRGISRSIDGKLKEQGRILLEIKKLEQERNNLLV